MLTKVKEYFLQKGFMTVAIREQEVEVLYRLVKGGLYYVCFINDTEGWLVDDRADRIMSFLQQQLSEKYKQYAEKTEGLMVVFTGKPKETKEKLKGSFNYWLAHPTARKLMIYEDQPDSFYDVKELMEGYWKQTPVMAMLSQLKVLGSPVNLTLIALNILIFIVLSIMGSTEDAQFMHTWGAMSVYDIVEKGEVYRLFTCMFLHFGVTHLLYNMVSLLYLGRALEGMLGKLRYAVTYICSGLCASACGFFWRQYLGRDYVVSAGASGAICGVAGALAYYMLRYRKQNKNFSFIRWFIFVALLMGQGIGDTSVDNAAHIGGVVFGFIIGAVIDLIPGKKKTGGMY